MARYLAYNSASFIHSGYQGKLLFPSWVGSGVSNWSIEIDFRITDISIDLIALMGVDGQTGAFTVWASGAIGIRGWVASSAGVIAQGVRYTVKLAREGNVLRVYVKPFNQPTYGSAVLTTPTGSNNNTFNALGRSDATHRVIDYFGIRMEGVGASYTETWDAFNAPSTGITWTGANGRAITLQGTQGTADAWWVFYNSITTTGVPNNTIGAALNQPCQINLNNYFTGATSYSVVSGSLPAGLSIVGNQIVGTPTSAQSTQFVIRAANSIDTLDSATITFNTGLWFLNNVSSGNARISIPQVTIGNNVGDYVEVRAVANAGNLSGNYRLLGVINNNIYQNLVEVTPTRVFVIASSIQMVFNTGYTQPTVGSIFTLRLTKTGVSQWTAALNGSVIGTASTAAALVVNGLFGLSNVANEGFLGGIYHVDISTNGGVSSTRYYDSNTSGGVGNLLIDRVSNQNGTQAGTWPADNSEWVSYAPVGGGPKIGNGLFSVSATGTVALPAFKTGIAPYTVLSAGSAVVASSKIGRGQASAAASAFFGLSYHKRGFGQPQVTASVAVALFTSNVKITNATFTVSAVAAAQVSGHKRGNGAYSVGLTGAATVSARKNGRASVNVPANATATAQARKVAIGQTSFTASAQVTTLGHKVGFLTPVALGSASIELFGFNNSISIPNFTVSLVTYSYSEAAVFTQSVSTYSINSNSGGY